MKKNAVVTGASRGIGFAIARKLRKDGMRIVMVATGTREDNQESLNLLTRDGVAWIYVQANTAESKDRQRIVERAVEDFDQIHVLTREKILVHEVRPGVIDTDMTKAARGKYDRLIERGAFPITRWGTGEDVVNAVSVLCGYNFLHTTGDYIDVDGGFHIRRL